MLAVARQAIERELNSLLVRHGWHPAHDTAVALRFAVLETLSTANGAAPIVARAEEAWRRLADVCHFDERLGLPLVGTIRRLAAQGRRSAAELAALPRPAATQLDEQPTSQHAA